MAKYYDHAMNCSNPAEAHAIAAVRRDAIKENSIYRVEANWKGQERFYWNGGRYDAICLARELVFNRAENVQLTRPNGEILNSDKIRELAY
jgi:hypothetical protein